MCITFTVDLELLRSDLNMPNEFAHSTFYLMSLLFPSATISQISAAKWFFLSEMPCVAFSPIAFVSTRVCVCACARMHMCARMCEHARVCVTLVDHTKTIRDKSFSKVKVMQILTVNISQTMTDMTTIAIATTSEVVSWLSIDVFAFDLGPF